MQKKKKVFPIGRSDIQIKVSKTNDNKKYYEYIKNGLEFAIRLGILFNIKGFLNKISEIELIGNELMVTWERTPDYCEFYLFDRVTEGTPIMEAVKFYHLILSNGVKFSESEFAILINDLERDES